MPIVEIAQIQLRRGSDTELPGAPTSLSPPVFVPGLKAGEMALVENLGRVFMGHTPSVGHANFQRVAFPFQNIEVLTENSADAFRRLFDGLSRSNETGHFISEPLAADNIWRPVLLPVPTGVTGVDPQPFRLSFPARAHEVSATITYAVISNDTFVKAGQMTIMSPGNGEPSYLIDECSQRRRTGLGEVSDPATLYDKVVFRAVTMGVAPATHLVLEARNALTEDARLMFRVDRPRP